MALKLHHNAIPLLLLALLVVILSCLPPHITATDNNNNNPYQEQDELAMTKLLNSSLPHQTPTESPSADTPTKPKHFNITTRRLGDLVEHQPSSISLDAPRGSEVEDQLIILQREDGSTTVAMTPKQQCDICHTTMDTGVILLRRGVQVNHAYPNEAERQKYKESIGFHFFSSAFYNDTTFKLQWSSQDMAEEICERAMLQYKPHYTIGCHELIAEHYDILWSAYNHADLLPVLFNDTAVLEHKLSTCHNTHKCVVALGLTDEQLPTATNTANNRTQCESCLELANDSRLIFKRLMSTLPNPENNPKLKERCQLSEKNFESFAKTWCHSLSMRHFKADGVLTDTCERLVIESNDEFYNLVKDGNMLHRLLKQPEVWEESLCVKMAKMCAKDDVKELYHVWDEAADYDFNITQALYLLHTTMDGHAKQLKDLEEEYFYSPIHLSGWVDMSAMTPEERAVHIQERKEQRKKDKEIKRRALEQNLKNDPNFKPDPAEFGEDQEEVSIDLDFGFDENDEKSAKQKKLAQEELEREEEEETTDLTPEMAPHITGKLSYINEQGVRVPNVLPPHVLREYKAKRHKLIHDIKHHDRIKYYQTQLDELRKDAPLHDGKRRVYALPDSMHVSKKMSAVLTRYMEKLHQREKGRMTESLLQETYNKQLAEMKEYSQLHQQQDLEKFYDIEDESSDYPTVPGQCTSKGCGYIHEEPNEVDNEPDVEVVQSQPRVGGNHHDEL